MQNVIRKSFHVFCLISGITLLSSCATLLGSKTNTLKFQEGVEAQVYLDDQLIGNAPGKIKLPAKQIQHGSTLRIEAEGYQEEEFLILRKPHLAYVAADMVGSIFLTGIPVLVDFSSGQIYRPVPRKINYTLEPLN